MSRDAIQDILSSIEQPSRYLGTEINTVKKDPGKVKMRIALAFPDVYEIGTSHFGLSILYHILNQRNEIAAERVFAPGLDMDAALRKHKLPILSLESQIPLLEFDIIGFSLLYELNYTNILSILDLSNIPFYASQRDDSHPLVIAGGPCTCNPEPVADLFDANSGGAIQFDWARAGRVVKRSNTATRPPAAIPSKGQKPHSRLTAPAWNGSSRLLEKTFRPPLRHRPARAPKLIEFRELASRGELDLRWHDACFWSLSKGNAMRLVPGRWAMAVSLSVAPVVPGSTLAARYAIYGRPFGATLLALLCLLPVGLLTGELYQSLFAWGAGGIVALAWGVFLGARLGGLSGDAHGAIGLSAELGVLYSFVISSVIEIT